MSDQPAICRIFEDDQILAVNKPAGIGTQAPRQFDSLEARVRDYLSQSQPADAYCYLGVPHRIDRCVSGVVVFAKRKSAARRLSQQFERREVEKVYLALVAGHLQSPQGTWRDTMRKVPDEPRAELVSIDHPDAKQAILHYCAGAELADRTQLEIRLETGRMHQIRLQCAAHGHAILGDKVYGSPVEFGPKIADERARPIALHAWRLTLEHPKRRERMTFQAELPGTWQA